jgi:hypothetical protein
VQSIDIAFIQEHSSDIGFDQPTMVAVNGVSPSHVTYRALARLCGLLDELSIDRTPEHAVLAKELRGCVQQTKINQYGAQGARLTAMYVELRVEVNGNWLVA